MSYCVNCGVELEKSERKCPLCGVEVVNPAAPYEENPENRPYPVHVEHLNTRIDRRYTASFLSVLLLVPALIAVFTNFITSGELSWSVYVIGGLLVVFTFCLLPLLAKKRNVYICLIVDGVAVALLLLLIESMGESPWFIELGLPLAMLGTLYALLAAFLISPARTMDPLARGAVGLTGAGLATVLVEIIIRLHQDAMGVPTWSGYVLIPCLVLSGCLLILNKRARLKSELKRRFFV